MGWFGPSKDEAWRQLSEDIGAEFIDVSSSTADYGRATRSRRKSALGRLHSTRPPSTPSTQMSPIPACVPLTCDREIKSIKDVII
jgi:hypothetical protein